MSDINKELQFTDLDDFVLAKILSYTNIGTMMSLGQTSKGIKHRTIDSAKMWLLRSGIPLQYIEQLDEEKHLPLSDCRKLGMAVDGVVACPECNHHQPNKKCMKDAKEAVISFIEKEEADLAKRRKQFAEAQKAKTEPNLEVDEEHISISPAEKRKIPKHYHSIVNECGEWEESMYIYARQHFGGGLEDHEVKFSHLSLCFNCGEVLNIPKSAFDVTSFFYEETPSTRIEHPSNQSKKRKLHRQQSKSFTHQHGKRKIFNRGRGGHSRNAGNRGSKGLNFVE
eukprot:GDKJ01016230.1.p1 GENE.GDKJ01016230.1~~GDKJ01016230.1.p1  ORF type:complete len:282 (-),score=45.32 GDKJ01016230.1:22-867(-)